MNETLTFENYQPQNIIIGGGGSVIGLTTVLVNGVDVTEGSVAYVVVPTKVSELQNDEGFINHEVDPTVPYHVKQISIADINKWNNKQDTLVSGTNIKTINNNSILGSGNLEIEVPSYSAGTGIDITNEVISNTITSYNDLTDLPTIPTKVSDLLNDSNYVSSSELSDVAFSGSYADLSNTPENLSEFTNDEGFITDETNTLQNYMLSEYLNNILPKVSGSGTDITLNDSAGSPLTIKLSGNTSQETTSISGGDEYDSPSPDHPQPIHSVTGDNTLYIEGTQLFNASVITASWIDISNDGKTIKLNVATSGNGSTSTGKKLKDVCPHLQVGNVAYLYFSRNLGTTYNNFIYLTGANIQWNNGTSKTITQAMLDSDLYLYANRYSDGETSQCILTDFRITKMQNASFTPYQSQTYPLTLGTLEYSKIGNYEDEFIKATNETGLESGKWYKKEIIPEVVLDGTEPNNNYAYDGTGTLARIRYTGLDNIAIIHSNYMSNYFGYLGLATSSNDEGISNTPTDNATRCFIFIDKTRLTSQDVAGFKTWLTTHNTKIKYIANTPTYTLLNDTLQTQLNNIEKALSYQNQTNISQVNQELPFNIEASTFKIIGGA